MNQPVEFVIPHSLAKCDVDLAQWREWACDLILMPESERETCMTKMDWRMRSALEDEIQTIRLGADAIPIDVESLAIVLRQIALNAWADHRAPRAGGLQ